MADPELQLLLKQEKEKLPSVPEMKELPPAPTMTVNIASLKGPSVSFADSNESWTEEVLSSYLPPSKQRKRAQVELFRHFTFQEVDLSKLMGPCEPAVYEKDLKTLKDIESEACNNFAGTESFLFRTVRGIIEIDNITTNAHNIYLEGRQMDSRLPDQDEASAQSRSISSRARCEKAKEILQRLQRLIKSTLKVELEKLSALQEGRRSRANTISKQQRVIDHVRSFDIDYVAKLRQPFALAAPELPERKLFYAQLSEDEQIDFWSQRILDEATIMSSHKWFATSVHLLNNLVQGAAMRRVFRTRMIYTAISLFDFYITPANLNYTVAVSADPVLRASIHFETGSASRAVYARLRALNEETGNGKTYEHGGTAGIVQLPTNSQ